MRLGIFLFYDRDGRVSDHVRYLLAKFSLHIDDLIFMSNGPIDQGDAKKLEPFVDQIVVRKNEGFDVGGYRDGILHVGFDQLAKYDEIVFFNYTVFGPVFDLGEMFGSMQERDVDFWGITEFNDGRKLFIQSYFIVTRRRLHASEDFKEYWLNMPAINSIDDSLEFHEFRFTPFFTQRGYRKDVYVANEESWRGNTTLANLEGLISKRMPVIKYRAFNFEPGAIERRGGMPAAANFDIVRTMTDYPVDLIWDYIIAQTGTDQVIDAITGTHIVPSATAAGADDAGDLRYKVFLSVEDAAHAEAMLAAVSHLDPARVFVASSNAAIVETFAASGCVGLKTEQAFTGAPILAFEGRIDEIVSDLDVVLNLSCFGGERDVWFFRDLVQDNYWTPLVGSLETIRSIGACFADNPRLGLMFAPTASVLGRTSRAEPLCPRASNWKFETYPADLRSALDQTRWPWRGNAALSGRLVRSDGFLSRLAQMRKEAKPEAAPRISGVEALMPELARKAGFASRLIASDAQSSKLVTRGSAQEREARAAAAEQASKFTKELKMLRDALEAGGAASKPGGGGAGVTKTAESDAALKAAAAAAAKAEKALASSDATLKATVQSNKTLLARLIPTPLRNTVSVETAGTRVTLKYGSAPDAVQQSTVPQSTFAVGMVDGLHFKAARLTIQGWVFDKKHPDSLVFMAVTRKNAIISPFAPCINERAGILEKLKKSYGHEYCGFFIAIPAESEAITSEIKLVFANAAGDTIFTAPLERGKPFGR